MSADNKEIVDRIQQLITLLYGEREQTKFLDRAGISSGYLGRLRGGKSADARKLVSIAAALNTTVEYLVTGDGPRTIDDVDVRDPYPSRQRAILLAKSLQLPESAIAVVRAHDPGRDPGSMYWFSLIEAEASGSVAEK